MSVDWSAVAARVFKEESARILAGLIRLSGSFDWAEEAMQDAFTRALTEWPEKGVPTNPGAWITTVARRRIVDRARRESTRAEYEPSVAAHLMSLASGDDTAEQEPMPEYPDDRLRLMFTCCHPALNIEARIALTLRTLGGLQTPEIARAFLVSEATMAQRLVRAKRKIQEARIPYETPRLDCLAERRDAVRAVLYLIFNEGYNATEGQALIRHELCREAIRLARMLCELVPDDSGHTFRMKVLFAFIRAVSRLPVPDAVKLNRYRPDFYGTPMRVVTHEAMRGPSAWSVGDRELMGACVSQLNECEVCTKTHAGVAALAYQDEARVSAALADLDSAPIEEPLRATLRLLRKLTREHTVDPDDIRAVLAAGVSREQIEDALAVCFTFNTVDRLSRAFGFVVSSSRAFEAGAKFLLARGYR